MLYPLEHRAVTLSLSRLVPACAEHNRPQAPPIRFDRNTKNEIILPGRWWADFFERTAELLDDPAERSSALHLSRVDFPDVTLPGGH